MAPNNAIKLSTKNSNVGDISSNSPEIFFCIFSSCVFAAVLTFPFFALFAYTHSKHKNSTLTLSVYTDTQRAKVRCDSTFYLICMYIYRRYMLMKVILWITDAHSNCLDCQFAKWNENNKKKGIKTVEVVQLQFDSKLFISLLLFLYFVCLFTIILRFKF